MQFASESLARLAEVAGQHGVKLGIENRQAVEELPLDSDLDLLLREFNRPDIGYWHDCGHAQIKENLGFINHRSQLENLAPRLLGMHVHDVVAPGSDHRAPGSGVIDFAALKPMIKPETLKVFELSPGLTRDEVVKGVAHIHQVWGAE
jgi:sugar phosphate isomerase/epimerase